MLYQVIHSNYNIQIAKLQRMFITKVNYLKKIYIISSFQSKQIFLLRKFKIIKPFKLYTITKPSYNLSNYIQFVHDYIILRIYWFFPDEISKILLHYMEALLFTQSKTT